MKWQQQLKVLQVEQVARAVVQAVDQVGVKVAGQEIPVVNPVGIVIQKQKNFIEQWKEFKKVKANNRRLTKRSKGSSELKVTMDPNYVINDLSVRKR